MTIKNIQHAVVIEFHNFAFSSRWPFCLVSQSNIMPGQPETIRVPNRFYRITTLPVTILWPRFLRGYQNSIHRPRTVIIIIQIQRAKRLCRMRIHDNNVIISELYTSILLLSIEPAGREKTSAKKNDWKKTRHVTTVSVNGGRETRFK